VKKGLVAIIAGGVVAALVIIDVVLTVVVGGSAERDVNDRLAKMPAPLVVEKHYHRGWFQSEFDATVSIPMGLRQLPGEHTMPLNLHAVVHHGPVCGLTCFGISRTEFTFEPTGELAKAAAMVFGSKPPLSGTATSGFFGGYSLTMSSPPVHDAHIGTDTTISSDGLTLQARGTRKGDRGEFHLLLPHLVTKTASIQTELTALKIDAKAEPTDKGEYEAAAAHFTAGPLVVKDLADAGSLVAITIPGMHVDYGFSHLQRKALEDLLNQVETMQRENAKQLAAAESDAPPTPPLAAMTALMTTGVQILANKPEFTLGFGVKMPDGSFEVSSSLGIAKEATADSLTLSAGLILNLEAKVEASLDNGVLTDLPSKEGSRAASVQTLQKLADAGYVKKEAHGWHAVLVYTHGQVTLNDRPLSSLAELQAIIGAPGSAPAP
jgi:hypothetical protein